MAGTFWNISNHPHERGPGHSGWSPDQIKTAESWGQAENASSKLKICDILFPDVDPRMDTQEIQAMANELLDGLMASGGSPEDPVHVMGEMTLTYALVVGLKARGLIPLASTTPRDSEIFQGIKVTRHQFVKFREYPTG